MAKKNGKVVTEKATKFAEAAKAKATKAQQERVSFLQSTGKAIAAAWAKLDKPNVMAVAKAIKADKVRLVDYVTVALGLRESKDAGLAAWVKADKALPVLTATSQPKARKAKVTKVVAGLNGKGGHEAQSVQA